MYKIYYFCRSGLRPELYFSKDIMGKRIFSLLAALAMVLQSANAQSVLSQEEKMEWWNEAKYGMFVHWGPYSLYGGVYNGFNQSFGGAEWVMNRCKIPVREYRAKASTFNPVGFNADSLVLMAKDAGMRYIVFTTKHHDGFAMFKSEASNFNIVDYTPYKRDIVDEIVQACKRHGMKIGFYYSQSQDWTYPGGSTARRPMKQGWPNPDSTLVDNYTKEHRGAWDHIQTTKTFDEYFHELALPQIKELVGRYGNDIGVIFFDYPQQMTKTHAEEVLEVLKDYPHIIINDRLQQPDFPGDYKTPEGMVPKKEDIEGIYWETCMNIGDSWGYKSWEKNWKSAEKITRNLITIASLGGNYLLNVGPDSQGQVQPEPREVLKKVGSWLSENGEAIYGTQRSEISVDWGVVVRKDSKKNSNLYLCVFNWPENGEISLPVSLGASKASLLASGEPLKFKNGKKTVTVQVPESMPDPVATVIRLELKGKLPEIHLVSNAQKYFEIPDAVE